MHGWVMLDLHNLITLAVSLILHSNHKVTAKDDDKRMVGFEENGNI
jgi:hypothetical protein